MRTSGVQWRGSSIAPYSKVEKGPKARDAHLEKSASAPVPPALKDFAPQQPPFSAPGAEPHLLERTGPAEGRWELQVFGGSPYLRASRSPLALAPNGDLATGDVVPVRSWRRQKQFRGALSLHLPRESRGSARSAAEGPARLGVRLRSEGKSLRRRREDRCGPRRHVRGPAPLLLTSKGAPLDRRDPEERRTVGLPLARTRDPLLHGRTRAPLRVARHRRAESSMSL